MTTIFFFLKDYKENYVFIDRVKSRLSFNLNLNLNLKSWFLITRSDKILFLYKSLILFHIFGIFSNYIRFNVINARMQKYKQWMLLSKKQP